MQHHDGARPVSHHPSSVTVLVDVHEVLTSLKDQSAEDVVPAVRRNQPNVPVAHLAVSSIFAQCVGCTAQPCRIASTDA